MNNIDLSISYLHKAYKDKALTPEQVVEGIIVRCKQFNDYNIWITPPDKSFIQRYIDNLTHIDIEHAPLWGIPFAIKDNIDLENIPTTAACPDFSFIPEKSAFVVQQLIDAGAIPIGKTNMDQFATGLVGTRSPYGACKNSIDPNMISGGSSSGSAVALALDLCSFSLGTDTAGSGRIPAFLNNVVGVKPTVGSLSATGMLAACRSLDSMSIFTKNIADAETVFNTSTIYDADDCYAKPFKTNSAWSSTITVGVPQAEQLAWFGNEESPTLYQQAINKIEASGAKVKAIDFSPFKEAADLLYQGPWVAERYAALENIMQTQAEILYPVTRKIIQQAENYNAVDTFKAQYQLQAYKQKADAILNTVDCIAIPTAATYYTIEDVENDPVQLNTNLGYYTNFMNLLDYAALAIPTGFYKNSMPFGITLFTHAMGDLQLLEFAKTLKNND